MPKTIRGNITAGGRYAIVVSRYNDSITSKLLDGALQTLSQAGVVDESIDVIEVPGAWEIPLAAGRLSRESGRYDAIVCLGAVIQGETSHDQHINRAVSHSLAELAMRSGIPVAFGVLTCGTLEQAIQRAGGAVGNKGVEAAKAALEMVDLLKNMPS